MIGSFYGKAVLGLVQVFTFNWIYFEVDGINLYMHAIRRKIWSGTSPLGIPAAIQTRDATTDSLHSDDLE